MKVTHKYSYLLQWVCDDQNHLKTNSVNPLSLIINEIIGYI